MKQYQSDTEVEFAVDEGGTSFGNKPFFEANDEMIIGFEEEAVEESTKAPSEKPEPKAPEVVVEDDEKETEAVEPVTSPKQTRAANRYKKLIDKLKEQTRLREEAEQRLYETQTQYQRTAKSTAESTVKNLETEVEMLQQSYQDALEANDMGLAAKINTKLISSITRLDGARVLEKDSSLHTERPAPTPSHPNLPNLQAWMAMVDFDAWSPRQRKLADEAAHKLQNEEGYVGEWQWSDEFFSRMSEVLSEKMPDVFNSNDEYIDTPQNKVLQSTQKPGIINPKPKVPGGMAANPRSASQSSTSVGKGQIKLPKSVWQEIQQSMTIAGYSNPKITPDDPKAVRDFMAKRPQYAQYLKG
jgi:hypothetical protein